MYGSLQHSVPESLEFAHQLGHEIKLYIEKVGTNISLAFNKKRKFRQTDQKLNFGTAPILRWQGTWHRNLTYGGLISLDSHITTR